MSEPTDRPPEADKLDRELSPPPALENRVVAALRDKDLLLPGSRNLRFGWRVMRASLAAAACIGILGIGVLIGQAITPAALTGAETDLYAVLLYETENYDRAEGDEALQRYSEYSQWVAGARAREQFVDGHDLVVERGWRIDPTGTVETTGSPEAAPMSGFFIIRAEGPEQALSLVQSIPHVAHGGTVVLQKTIPTATPPQ